MSLLITAAIVSVGIVGLMSLLARSRLGMGGAIAVSGFGCLLFSFVFSPALALQCLLTCLAGILCLVFHAKPKTFLGSSIGAALASFALFVGLGLQEWHEREQLRKQYPMQSVAHRLEYETERNSTPNQNDASEASPQLSSQVQERLQDQEDDARYWGRSGQLRSLHRRTTSQFVMAQGFGPVRMAGTWPDRIKLPEAKSIPLPSPPEDYPYDQDAADGLAAEDAGTRIPPRESFLSLHDSGLNDFLDPERMGYVKSRDEVAGFLPHHFREVPRLNEKQVQDNWQVTRLELVSLLKYETPRVYVSRHLPKMDELKDAPTRPLNGFEKRGLPKLRHEQDLVVEEGLNRIRMLGSLRAGEDCMQCHLVERGELLGAFSYDLYRAEPVEPPENEPPAEPQARRERFGGGISMTGQR